MLRRETSRDRPPFRPRFMNEDGTMSCSFSLSFLNISHYRGLCMPDVRLVSKVPSVTPPFPSVNAYSTLLSFSASSFSNYRLTRCGLLLFSLFSFFSSFSSFYVCVFPSLFLNSLCHSFFSFVTLKLLFNFPNAYSGSTFLIGDRNMLLKFIFF